MIRYYDYVLQRKHLVSTFAKRNKKQANSRIASKKSKIKKPTKIQEVDPTPDMLFDLACQALTRAYLRVCLSSFLFLFSSTC